MSQIPVNGKCPLCEAPAYVGLGTRVECTGDRCTNSPSLSYLGEISRARLRELWARLDALGDSVSPLSWEIEESIKREIKQVIGG